MAVIAPFNLKKWIAENRDLLKPPVGNQCIYKNAENFIVMVVGGPNARKDYHFNESEELYYQVEGNIVLKIIDDGVQRAAGTVGLVIEKIRENEKDGFLWYCEKCGHKLYEEFEVINDIVTQLPPIMNGFYSDEHKRTCNKCGAVMEAPIKKG